MALEVCGELDDIAVRTLFDDANTVGVPLMGGEILKARHYGVMIEAEGREDQAKNCEMWLNGKKDAPDLGLQVLKLQRLDDDARGLSLNDFIDARESAFGPRFVEQLLGRIMGERDGWWRPLAEKTTEHLDPFEFYKGLPEGSSAPAIWSASAPGSFKAGLGYFQMVQRIGLLYADYVKNIKTPDVEKPLENAFRKHGSSLSECVRELIGDGNPTDTPIPGCRGSALTPGRLVVLAAEIAVCALRGICRRYDEQMLKVKLDGAHNPDIYAKTIVGLSSSCDEHASICELLGFRKNDGGGWELTTPAYGMPVGLFAVALVWHDAFLRSPPNAAVKSAEVIVRLLVLLIFNTLRRSRFATVEAQLQLPAVLEASRSSRTIESAWWAFKHKAFLDQAFLMPFARLAWEIEREGESTLENVCLAWCGEIIDELFPQDL